MFRNPEIKSIAAKLLVFQIVFSIFIFIIAGAKMEKLNERIIDQNAALVGNILTKHPDLENDIIKYITNGPSQEEIGNGRKILSQYGYDENLEKVAQPLLKNISPKIEIILFVVSLGYFIPLLLLIISEYNSIYKKVRKISFAAERVVEGDFSIKLKEEGEGDFSILSNQFNNMSNRLESTLGSLKEEKIFLKNIISDISHQLKTPLSSLIMLNELIIEDENMEEDIRKDFLNKMKSQLSRMEWLIINLLKLARIEAGAIQFREERVPLIEVVKASISSLNMKASEKKQKINIIGENEDFYLYGDMDWTIEALTNIIKNSIEHSYEGGEIKISLGETPLFSQIIIEDNGEGIDEKDLPHIFKRFYKASTKVKAESIGIGLNLSKSIIEAQNGSIKVRSEKGIGTKFIITFLKGVI
ncbi:HAMP domain-containing sensor histidine kinase [Anaerosalibacter massiliensis]|uniref:histidine kinase n=1 Tax=Anaerosalibacter massiliensis TaxID=1347392 RepID=A0A9X2S6I9_9FIRM|nr:HAMP domain-containing sensor histidine kinase [Anaerosalibacter massiliensis]MCR2043667.1 HAMP domain-containing histidine kinase [Anaerosalibacter massiliensis]